LGFKNEFSNLLFQNPVHVLSTVQGLAMSALFFVNSDGSNQTDSLNKKLVRDHVTKYFHPRKQGKWDHIEKQQPRRIAPKIQLEFQPELGVGTSSVTSFIDDEEELEDPAFPNTNTAPGQTSDQSVPPSFSNPVIPDEICSVNGSANQGFEPEIDQIHHIKPAAILGLPKSGTQREKNTKAGLLKEGKVIIELQPRQFLSNSPCSRKFPCDTKAHSLGFWVEGYHSNDAQKSPTVSLHI
jgi:hypothetical protein